jgi:hypothetical protein
MSGWLLQKSFNHPTKEVNMNVNDEDAYDQKMEEIIVSLEVFILDIIRAAVNRLMENNAAFLKNAPNQNLDGDF